uniref:Waprin-Rha1 n=1 Tax=Rhabdophis tigrinus tigrinus TaxID=193080 RepID=WAP1_RHATT|nr:RecName: Full=Waprin-Rha1; Flags: Precursor [Rhabdophis tigrinus tigrinus]ABU68541.1 Waprin-Rha1 [Rhabdophis tigrinus]
MQARVFLLLLGVILLGMMGPMVSAQDGKAGSCPDVNQPIPPLGVCKTTCATDSNCPDIQKCCKNGCGHMSCTRPST